MRIGREDCKKTDFIVKVFLKDFKMMIIMAFVVLFIMNANN